MRARTAPIVAVAAVIALFLQAPNAAGDAGKIKASLNQIGPQNGGGEPSVAIAPDGMIYVSAPGNAMARRNRRLPIRASGPRRRLSGSREMFIFHFSPCRT